jgi:hypothetical protein
MPFLAQIDLSELSSVTGKTALPSHGAFAFFAGDSPLQYVVDPGMQDCDLPSDLPAASTAGYNSPTRSCWEEDPLAARVFPKWPVEFLKLGVDGKPGLPSRDCNFHWRQHHGGRLLYWHTAMLFADQLRIAADFEFPNKRKVIQRSGRTPEALEEDLRKVEQGMAAVVAMREEVLAWLRGHQAWDVMTQDELEKLEQLAAQLKGDTRDWIRNPRIRLEDLEHQTLLELATAEASAYSKAPAELRSIWNEQYRLPPGPWHQIFGDPIDIQGNAGEEAESKYLLLRLSYDDMLHWGFGDNGAYHFFIGPEDLARRRWSAANMIFECH